jgi:methionyl-tRNA formyltransferase
MSGASQARALRVGFAGTPEFARVALEALHVAGFAVPLVLTQPDRPAGRGMKLQPSPVKQFALQQAMALAQPTSLRLDGKYPDEAAAAQAALLAADLDVLVVAAYGLILPQWVLDLPRLGCLNIHASLLPRWRGAAPIHRAIEAGDAQTGITIMQMDAGLDTGAMLLVEPEVIRPDDTTARLHDRLAAQGGRLIVQALELAAAGGLRATVQPEEGITYAHKIDKSEAALDWSLPAEQLARRARAFDPFPGCTFGLAGETVKLWAAQALSDAELADIPGLSTGLPTGLSTGDVLAVAPDSVVVACGSGALRLTQLQRPGGKRLPAQDYLRAHPIAVGTRLG